MGSSSSSEIDQIQYNEIDQIQYNENKNIGNNNISIKKDNDYFIIQ